MTTSSKFAKFYIGRGIPLPIALKLAVLQKENKNKENGMTKFGIARLFMEFKA